MEPKPKKIITEYEEIMRFCNLEIIKSDIPITELEKQISSLVQQFLLKEIIEELSLKGQQFLRDFENEKQEAWQKILDLRIAVSFAMRNCSTQLFSKHPTKNDVIKILELCRDFRLADPIPYMADSHLLDPFVTIERMAVTQISCFRSIHGCLGRGIALFEIGPNEIGKTEGDFNFTDAFTNFYKMTYREFAIYCLCMSRSALRTRGYFKKAEDKGIKGINETNTKAFLKRVCADRAGFNEEYEGKKHENRLWAAYDYNPLTKYPVVRPYETSMESHPDVDYLTAPVPFDMFYKLVFGVYYDFRDEFGHDWRLYFGRLFEWYVGEIIKKAFIGKLVLDEMNNPLNQRKGKKVDWLVIEDDVALLFEIKAVGLDFYATGQKAAIGYRENDDRLVTAVKQLHQVSDKAKKIGINGKSFETYNLVVALENVMFSDVTRERINLAAGVPKEFEWQIINISGLEEIEPYIRLITNFHSLLNGTSNDLMFALKSLNKKFPEARKNSWVSLLSEEFFEYYISRVESNQS